MKREKLKVWLQRNYIRKLRNVKMTLMLKTQLYNLLYSIGRNRLMNTRISQQS